MRKIRKFDIKFRDMTDEDFNRFFEDSIFRYSKELIEAGNYNQETAFANAKIQFYDLLPLGNHTKGHFLYKIINSDNENLGHLWYEKYEDKTAFICDFLILKKFRKKGYGKQALLLLEEDAKNKGFNKVFLHVFIHNDNAISLYKYLGYKIFKEESGGMYLIKDI